MKLLLITSVPIRIQMIYRKKKSLKMKPKLKLRNMVIKSKKKSKLKSKKKSNLRQKYKEVTLVNSHTEIGHYLPFLLIVASASQVCKKWKLLSEDQSLWLKINLTNRKVPVKFIEAAFMSTFWGIVICELGFLTLTLCFLKARFLMTTWHPRTIIPQRNI